MPLAPLLSRAAGKPRGYAFIEYESKKDMKEAYKAADGRKLEGKRVLVDVERGRTVENWWVKGQGQRRRRHPPRLPWEHTPCCILRGG